MKPGKNIVLYDSKRVFHPIDLIYGTLNEVKISFLVCVGAKYLSVNLGKVYIINLAIF